MASSIIPCLFAILFVVNAAYGLECYTCNSNENTACSWGLVSFTLPTQTCASAGIFNGLVGPKCFKITAKNKDGAEFTAKGCQDPPGFGCEIIAKTAGWLSGLNNGEIRDLNCYTCNGDRCNSAKKLTGMIMFGLLLSAFVFIF